MTEQNGVEQSSATDILRRMLDERGVKWRKTPHYSSESQDNETIFEGSGIEWLANDHLNGRLGLRTVRYEVTPEQTVAATVGNGDTSRWHELFGTPESAARTLETVAESLFSSAWSDDTATLSDVACAMSTTCGECPAKGARGHGVTTRCGEVDYDLLLEWLRGDVK